MNTRLRRRVAALQHVLGIDGDNQVRHLARHLDLAEKTVPGRGLLTLGGAGIVADLNVAEAPADSYFERTCQRIDLPWRLARSTPPACVAADRGDAPADNRRGGRVPPGGGAGSAHAGSAARRTVVRGRGELGTVLADRRTVRGDPSFNTVGDDVADITHTVGGSQRTVYRYRQLEYPPERKPSRRRRILLTPFIRTVLTRWNEVSHNVMG